MGNDFFMTKIRQLRKEKNLTMEQLAIEIGVTKSRVNMWENNGTVPRQDALIRISEYFQVSTDDLLGNVQVYGEDIVMHTLQRNLKKLSTAQLKKANEALKLLFSEIWTDEEDHGDL